MLNFNDNLKTKIIFQAECENLKKKIKTLENEIGWLKKRHKFLDVKKLEIEEKLRVNEIKEEKKEVDKQNAKLKAQVIKFIEIIHE